ncbi:DUF4421 domain-containing protein [Dawidia soli]|uniref:DUF4421 family protein n=1 Tax=Dawidia soli TaxID=2782352 RepID=A0AAP2DDW3_9BACT|nr:DUF4421 domain-containing protein [Dawidia soli]MBT1690254.1 DUF4421 family protein [Dawidia soli]
MKTRFLLLFFLLSLLGASAQTTQTENDPTYYVSYERYITGRYYFSRKYTSFDLRSLDDGVRLRYRPNTTLNMGIGATYKWATLNLAYGFPFLNPTGNRGKTRYLDLQVHNYGRKIVIDLFGQFYRGFYLNNESLRKEDGTYYQRPDMLVQMVGASGLYLFNHRRFSYRASFLQNEWQKRSAGSFLLGWEIFVGRGKADSSFIPSPINDATGIHAIDRVSFVETGPSIGYAYTFVFKKHFFATASSNVSLDYGKNLIYTDEGIEHSESFSPNSLARLFAGYNSDKWALSFTFVHQIARISSNRDAIASSLNTGNFRFNAVYRFLPNRKTRKVLKEVIK